MHRSVVLVTLTCAGVALVGCTATSQKAADAGHSSAPSVSSSATSPGSAQMTPSVLTATPGASAPRGEVLGTPAPAFGDWKRLDGPKEQPLGTQYRFMNAAKDVLVAVMTGAPYDAALIKAHMDNPVEAGDGLCGVSTETRLPGCVLPVKGGTVAVGIKGSSQVYQPLDIFPHAQAYVATLG